MDRDGKALTKSFTKFLAVATAVPVPPVHAPAPVSVAPQQPASVARADCFQWIPFGVGAAGAQAVAAAAAAAAGKAAPKKAKKAAAEAPPAAAAESPKKKAKKEKAAA